MTGNRKLEGIWAAVHTPFRDDHSLDEVGIALNIDHFADRIGLQGIFFNGLFGEHWALSLEERKRIVEVSAKATRGRISLSPNCTHHSLKETIDLAHHAEAAGCEYVVLMNPSTGPRGEAELFRWFSAVAESIKTDLFIFNTPQPGYVLSANLIARLAQSGRFKVLKAAGGSHEVGEARRLVGDLMIVSDPSEGTWLGNLLANDQTLLYADAEPMLFQSAEDRPIESMLQAYKQKDLAGAVAIHKQLSPMRRVYETWVSGPIRKGVMSCAAIKYWASKRGMAAGPVRAPLVQFSSAEKDRMDSDLRGVGVV